MSGLCYPERERRPIALRPERSSGNMPGKALFFRCQQARGERSQASALDSLCVPVTAQEDSADAFLCASAIESRDPQGVVFNASYALHGRAAMNWQDRICIDPKVLGGKPVIKGTRLAVEKIVELMAAGWSEHQIIENHPGVSHEDISACLFYASEVLKSERVVALASSR